MLHHHPPGPQLAVVLPVLVGQWPVLACLYGQRAVGVQVLEALVAAVGEDLGAGAYLEAALLVELEVMLAALGHRHADDPPALPVDDQLGLDGVPFLLARIVPPLFLLRAFDGALGRIDHHHLPPLAGTAFQFPLARQPEGPAANKVVLHPAHSAPALGLAYAEVGGDVEERAVFPVVHQHRQQLVFRAQQAGAAAQVGPAQWYCRYHFQHLREGGALHAGQPLEARGRPVLQFFPFHAGSDRTERQNAAWDYHIFILIMKEVYCIMANALPMVLRPILRLKELPHYKCR